MKREKGKDRKKEIIKNEQMENKGDRKKRDEKKTKNRVKWEKKKKQEELNFLDLRLAGK